MKGYLFGAGMLILLAGCTYFLLHPPRSPSAPRREAAWPPSPAAKTSGCAVRDGLPDAECTPGALLAVTADKVCVRGYSKGVRHVTDAVKRQAYHAYGMEPQPRGTYELDHLISLELGGSNEVANLWPEAAGPHPGFHEKDIVENWLHDQVCNHGMDLAEAQRQIATDWHAVYQRIPARLRHTDDAVVP